MTLFFYEKCNKEKSGGKREKIVQGRRDFEEKLLHGG